jgi:hypothetical protein
MVQVEYYGRIGGHGGHNVSTLSEGEKEAKRIIEEIPGEEPGSDETLYVAVIDEWDLTVFYCTEEYHDLMESLLVEPFKSSGIAADFLKACKKVISTGKPVKVKSVCGKENV